jgi:hypothetical protein
MFRLRVIQSRPPNFVVSLEEAFSLCFEEAFSDRYLVLTVLYVLYCSLVFISLLCFCWMDDGLFFLNSDWPTFRRPMCVRVNNLVTWRNRIFHSHNRNKKERIFVPDFESR